MNTLLWTNFLKALSLCGFRNCALMCRLFLLAVLFNPFFIGSSVSGSSFRKASDVALRTWTVSEYTGQRQQYSMDTVSASYAFSTPMSRYSILNSWNGTWGSPLQSAIWFDRSEDQPMLFSRAYDAYFLSPAEFLFYNTHTPFAVLDYHTFGGSQTKEDDFSALFTVNVNSKLNIGGLMEYMRAMGMYSNQATKQVKAGGFLSYDGNRYDADGAFMYQRFENEENGGIQSSDYIRNADMRVSNPVTVPIRLNNEAQNRLTTHWAYYSHRYHFIGVQRKEDSIHVDFRPILSLFHLAKFMQTQHRYRESSIEDGFYADNFYSDISTRDSLRTTFLTNTVGLEMNEGFSDWIPFSLTAYAEHQYEQNYCGNDYAVERCTDHHVIIGASASRFTGSALNFHTDGRLWMAGPYVGDWLLQGRLSSALHFATDSVSIQLNALSSGRHPQRFEQHYFSNHFRWDLSSPSRVFRSRLTGMASWIHPWIHLRLWGGMETVSNWVYYDLSEGMRQVSSDFQIISMRGDIALRAWFLHLDNSIVFQNSSMESVVSLPKFVWKANVYASFNLFRVLQTRIGVDCDWFSKYYAPAYVPAIMAFCPQQQEKVGNYPLLSAYASFKLYTARFFFRYYHLNQRFGSHEYFSMPDYPLYDSRFQMGLTWHFFD